MKRTILLADDSPTIQRLVTQTFADSDFTVVSVSNGDAAIRKLDEIHADIVLADVYMPGRNGYEVCAYVRSRAARADVPVILLAGAFDAYDEQTAATSGATAHIRKPFEPRALVSLVMSVSGRVDVPAPAAHDTGHQPVSVASALALADVSTPLVTTVPPPAEPFVEMRPETKPEMNPGQTVNVRGFVDTPPSDTEDVLGLEELFKPAERNPAATTISDEEIDRIAERVVRKITKEAIENVAWDVVPDMVSQILRDEINRKR